MGRSTGIQVQAISRSGTNNTDGSFYGFFRSDKLNAADNFTKTVLPYSNQQIGGTLGGPIRHNKLQYFVSYEKENEPNTAVIAPNALSGQLFSIPVKREVRPFLAGWTTVSEKDHLTIRSAMTSGRRMSGHRAASAAC